MDNRSVSVLVATDEEGFSLHRVRGPYRWVHMGRHFRQNRDIRLASAAIAALHTIPYKLFAAQAYGPEYTGKLPVLLKSSDDGFLDQMKRLGEMADDAGGEWQILQKLAAKYELKLKKVAERSSAMEHLKAFHRTPAMVKQPSCP